MTTDFRALITRMAKELDEYRQLLLDDRTVTHRLSDEARAALVDEPAVHECREPAAVTKQSSDKEWDALVERSWDKYKTVGYQGERFMYDSDFDNALEFVRRELALWGTSNLTEFRSLPDDGEVAELVAWLQETGDTIQPSHLAEHQRYKRAAELLERQALVPVAVSERPWECEGWCDAKGNCWLGGNSFDGSTPTWLYGPSAWAERFPNIYRVLLPANALALPEVGE